MTLINQEISSTFTLRLKKLLIKRIVPMLKSITKSYLMNKFTKSQIIIQTKLLNITNCLLTTLTSMMTRAQTYFKSFSSEWRMKYSLTTASFILNSEASSIQLKLICKMLPHYHHLLQLKAAAFFHKIHISRLENDKHKFYHTY